MKRIQVILLSISLLMVVLSSKALAVDAVNLVCLITIPIPPPAIKVAACESSDSTLFDCSSALGTSCAQALANLVTQGFSIVSVQQFGLNDPGLSYTLIKITP